jgi:hypothetical protein
MTVGGRAFRIVVAERFNGPPGSGNGGYVCGTLAAHVGAGPVAVRLLRPPRLGVPHAVDGGRLLDGDTIVAQASAWTDGVPDLPRPVPPADAAAATRHFAGHVRHPFPSCFGCGTDRPDGLRIFPGPVAGTTSVAAPWSPGPALEVAGSIPAPVVWTALDCPGGWSVIGSAVVVLGTMAGQTLRPVCAGEELVVTAAPAGVDGRKHYAVSAVRTATGELVAWSHQTWIEVD